MKTGVLLFNLGGPETLDDVRPFLYNLFSDPEIIRIKSDLLRRILAYTISTTRQRKSKNLYSQIGGGSPLRKITDAQAGALKAALEAKGFSANTYVGMRCWRPSIDEAAGQILKDEIRQLVLLPLFPQYSGTTTGSCLRYFQSLDKKLEISSKMRVLEIRNWFAEPLYVEAVSHLIRKAAHEFSRGNPRDIHLLYSAHSIPARYIDEGDPYLEQTRQSVELLNQQLGNAFPHSLAFQSKVGPVKWLEPSTKDVLVELGKKGISRVLVVPISFVSDHIETLQEIDIAYRKVAIQSGIKEFRRVPSLNVDPGFINALAELVIRKLSL